MMFLPEKEDCIMKLNRSELGHRRAEKLVKALKDGTFKKELQD